MGDHPNNDNHSHFSAHIVKYGEGGCQVFPCAGYFLGRDEQLRANPYPRCDTNEEKGSNLS
jgi:hypothetical protein